MLGIYSGRSGPVYKLLQYHTTKFKTQMKVIIFNLRLAQEQINQLLLAVIQRCRKDRTKLKKGDLELPSKS